MKDIWILSATAAVMIALLLTGQLMRGDFEKETLQYEAAAAETGGAVIERDGRALINVNMADAETLALIDGIGPALSGRIVEYREKKGGFSSLDELLEVDGVGEKKLEAMKERLFCPE